MIGFGCRLVTVAEIAPVLLKGFSAWYEWGKDVKLGTPSSQDDINQTPLHLAAWEGHIKMVALLLSHMDSGQIAATDDEGQTALHLTAGRGHRDVVALRIDCRMLKSNTLKHAYTLPRIQEYIDKLGKVNRLSSIHLLSGYWQLKSSTAI